MASRDLVFISYAREDENWLDKLLLFLEPYQETGRLVPWVDTQGLREGEEWQPQLEAALDRTSVAVILVSSASLASKFIRNVEIPRLIAARNTDGVVLLPVMVETCVYKASKLSALQFAHKPDLPLADLVGNDLNRALVEIVYKILRVAPELGDVEPQAAPETVESENSTRADSSQPSSNFAGAAPSTAQSIGAVEHSTNGALGKLHGVPNPPPNYQPREDDLAQAKAALLEGQTRTLGITASTARIGVHGMGGLGKTVLTAALVQEEAIRQAFPDGIYWITLGQEPATLSLQSTLYTQLAGTTRVIESVHDGHSALREALSDKRCLLVIDDAWDLATLRAFDAAGPQGATLVTTRDASLLTAIGAMAQPLEKLPLAGSRSLLAAWAKLELEQLPDAANKVAELCDGLPLALSVVGAMAVDKVPWDALVNALEQGKVAFLNHPYGSVFPSLTASVDRLAAGDCERYLELAVFDEDVAAPVSVVCSLWRHTGGLESFEADALLAALAGKSLLSLKSESLGDETGEVNPHAGQPPPRAASILFHALQHDYLRFRANKLPELHGALLEALAANSTASPGQHDWASLAVSTAIFIDVYLGVGEHIWRWFEGDPHQGS